ncbi:DUF5988 family protein [Streptomyces bambusae]|uniref:Uncharacterized protein n=1 Tax=Streptomyces bambusae TaxID=1550616 RepID=A0ABS6Z9B3_9ACTN|nr:DUF5988 family protein [Streptomyces bambusae]MBW5483260.1 hypothetical protein [Streptomyces bambusae]
MKTKTPNVILRGGPAQELAPEDRVRYVSDTTDKVKVLWGNRYEHFSPTEGTVTEEELELLVYQHSGYTYVAE